jgi:hypothetical protein
MRKNKYEAIIHLCVNLFKAEQNSDVKIVSDFDENGFIYVKIKYLNNKLQKIFENHGFEIHNISVNELCKCLNLTIKY